MIKLPENFEKFIELIYRSDNKPVIIKNFFYFSDDLMLNQEIGRLLTLHKYTEHHIVNEELSCIDMPTGQVSYISVACHAYNLTVKGHWYYYWLHFKKRKNDW